MHWPEFIGYVAAVLTTCSFVPQVWHTFRTRDVSGISLGMYSAFACGVALWLVYGLLLAAWPIVLANAITLGLASARLAMKLRYRSSQSVAPRTGQAARTRSQRADHQRARIRL